MSHKKHVNIKIIIIQVTHLGLIYSAYKVQSQRVYTHQSDPTEWQVVVVYFIFSWFENFYKCTTKEADKDYCLKTFY